jgi:hypothetical protein
MNLLPATQPQAGTVSLAQVDGQCTQIEAWAESCASVPELRDAANKLAAIDEYLSRTSTEGRARVAAAMRRLEVRIGQVLGPPPSPRERGSLGGRPGGIDTASPPKALPRGEELSPKDRSQFRSMAENEDIVEEAIAESTDERPASRRQVQERIKAASTPKPAETWSADEKLLRKRMETGDTVVVSMRCHQNLIAWARSVGQYVRIDRNSKWGNPFVMPDDGDRAEVIRNYADHYLPFKPSLQRDAGELMGGKALGCWCAPEPCHGDILAEIANDNFVLSGEDFTASDEHARMQQS